MRSMLFLFTFTVVCLGPAQGLFSTKTIKSRNSTLKTLSPQVDTKRDDVSVPNVCTDQKAGGKSTIPRVIPSVKKLLDAVMRLIFGDGPPEKDLPNDWVQYMDCYSAYFEKAYAFS